MFIKSSFCDPTRDVAVATNFVAKFAKLSDSIFIRHAGVPKRIAGSQFRFQIVNGNSLISLHHVKFGEIRSSNNADYDARNVYSRRQSNSHPVILEFTGLLFAEFSDW